MKSLILRTCNDDMTSHDGFVWPKSGYVSAPDWIANRNCGNGLHGLLNGDGNWAPLDKGSKNWLVCEVESRDIIDLNGKVKFPKCNVIFCGSADDALQLLARKLPGGLKIHTLDLHSSSVTVLPEGLECRALYLGNSNVTVLPEGLKCHFLSLGDSKITDLPEDLKCHTLDLRYSKVTALPEGLKCHTLDLRCSSVTDLPKGFKCHSVIR